jgi:hypothetical protein
VCWKLQQAGGRLAFNPSAVILHHRRNSVRAFWKQQRGYGYAEALLEKKWPEKYTITGQITWTGRLYGHGVVRALRSVTRIYHGVWGVAPFQSIYEPAPGFLSSLPHMPEWYLVLGVLFLLSVLGLSWRPLALAVIPLAAMLTLAVVHAGVGAARAHFPRAPRRRFQRVTRRVLTALLFLTQPMARLAGRTSSGLTPWRRHGSAEFKVPWVSAAAIWSERWQDAGERLAAIEQALKKVGECVRRGGNFDRWDLEVRGGAFGGARLLMAVEEHGLGRQLVRVRTWPKIPAKMLVLVDGSALLSLGAARDHALVATTILGLPALLCGLRALRDCAAAVAAFRRAVAQSQTPEP